MICTVTLNTSIDKAYQISSPLEVGEVQRVSTVIDVAGGKGLNCSRAISTCGEEVLATGFVGGNNGQLLCDLLEADGISEDFVRVATETRCCINVLEPSSRSTEFLEPGRQVTPAEVEALEGRLAKLVERADVVTMNGSVPAGLPTDTYRRLVSAVRGQGKPCILDTSGELLLNGIKACPTMVKPNTDEIGAALGRTVSTIDEVVDAARELHGRGDRKSTRLNSSH